MRRTRFRRKPRVQWLPTFGVGPDIVEQEDTYAPGVYQSFQLAQTGEIVFDAVPLTYDYSDSSFQEQGSYSRSLQDLVGGNNYRLRRVVGKVFGTWVPDLDYDSILSVPPAMDLACGLIVCRTDDEGNPITDFNACNPLAQDAAEDPWIWRRRWFIGTVAPFREMGPSPGWTNVNLEAYYGLNFPTSTAGYGSVADGPHVDQKTARVIDRQERLFFISAARVFGPTAGGPLRHAYNYPGFASVYFDYRLLGSIIRTPTGNRRNASR